MAYFEQNGEHYNEEIRKIEITDPAHADLINDLIQLLVNNDAFIKKYIDNHLNVDNTADIDKPVSTAQATAIAAAKKAGTDAQTNINNHTSNINNPHNVTKTQVGLSNVDNTADINKPVSVAQQDAIDAAYANSNYYTDQKIAELINGAPTTLDTLKEIADAMAEQESVVEALDEAIGKKANESEFNSHVTNKSNPHGVTASQVGALATNGDSKSNTVTFTSNDVADGSATGWTIVSKLTTGITHATFFQRVSQMFKNVRYLYKMLGTTDISGIGDGTVTGGLSTLNSNFTKTQIGTSEDLSKYTQENLYTFPSDGYVYLHGDDGNTSELHLFDSNNKRIGLMNTTIGTSSWWGHNIVFIKKGLKAYGKNGGANCSVVFKPLI